MITLHRLLEIYEKQPLTASLKEAVRGCFNRGLLENVEAVAAAKTGILVWPEGLTYFNTSNYIFHI